MKNRIGRIYMITCNVTGKKYIGSTTMSLIKRFYYYQSLNCRTQKKLYNSFVKYGIENHTFEEIWQGDIQSMLQKECILGHFYDVLSYKEGLNLKLPDLNDKYSCISEETRKKMSLAKKDRKLTEEHKAKIRLKSQTERYCLGRKHDKESILKMSRKVICDKTGQIFDSVEQAAAFLGIKYSTLYTRLNGQNSNKTSMRFLDPKRNRRT